MLMAKVWGTFFKCRGQQPMKYQDRVVELLEKDLDKLFYK